MAIKSRLPIVALLIALLVSTFAALGGNYATAAPPLAPATAAQAQPAAPRACVTPPANLTAWYPLDELAGPTSADIAGGNNGNWVGSPSALPGKVAGALRFLGPSGHVSVPSASGNNFGSGDFSVDFWVRELNGQGGRRVFIDKRDNTSPALTGWSIGQINGQIYIELGDGATANTFVASGPLMNDGAWHFAGFIVSRATPAVTLYLDGAVVGTYTSGLPSGSINSLANMLMGNNYNISGHQEIIFDGGWLDEVELFNRALSPNEFAPIWNAQSMGKCKGGQPSPTPTCIPGQTCPTDTPTATPTCVIDPTGQCVTLTPTCPAGQICGTDTPTDTPTVCPPPGNCATDTPHPTDTPIPTDTPRPSDTPTATYTPQLQPSNTPTVTPTPACATPPSGMTAWYPLDELAGPTSADIAGGNNGNWVGSPSALPGKVAGALRFLGPSGHVSVPSASGNNFGSGDFSVDFWVRELNGQGGRRVFIDKRDNTAPALTGWSIGQINGQIYIELGDGATANTFVASGPLMNDGAWHFAGFIVSRATPAVTLYLDGAVVGTYTSGLPSGSINSLANMLMGNNYNISGHQEIIFDGGWLDEVELFNRALSPNEFAPIWNAQSMGKCKGQQATATVTPRITATATCVLGQNCATSTPTATATCVVDPPTGLCATPTIPATSTRTATPTLTPGCIQPPSGMQAWYPLDETVPATSAEIIAGSNATWYFGPAPTAGKVAGALSFNGANSFAQRAPAPANLNMGSTDFSVDMWVKTSAVPGVVVLIDHRQNISKPSTRIGYEVFLYNGKLGFQMSNGLGATATYINFGGPNVGNNNWNFITITVQRNSATGLKMYVNGAPVVPSTTNTIPVNGNITTIFPFRIGGPLPSIYHDRYLRGALDEIELFGRVLLNTEVSALYNAGSYGKCKPQSTTPTPTFTATPCIPGQTCPSPTPTNTPILTVTIIPTLTQIPNTFVDINGNVFANSIGDLYTRGAVSGTDPTHFSPAGTSTRAQFAKVVVISFSLYDYRPDTPDFTDVPTSYFAYSYIEAGYAAGILSGFDANTCAVIGAQYPCYGPNRPITRGQLTKLVVGADGYELINPPTQTFSDVGLNNVFYQFIETAHAHEVINGYSDGTFRPNNNIRRDEMCQIVYKGVYNF